MSVPVIRVLVGFQTTADFGDPFQLDNATFGELDTGTLGGLEFADLTTLAQSVSITRGRNRESEQFNAGPAVISFDDPQRLLDPLNTDSPFYPFVGPRNPVEVYANGIQIYSGLITGWNLSYGFTTSGNLTVANCADILTVLANQNMNEFTPSSEKSGERVRTVLNLPEVQYQGPVEIDDGRSTLGGFLVSEGTSVLNYLQTVATSEQGYLFAGVDGTFNFFGRDRALNPVATVEFADDGTAIRYQSLTNNYDDEHLYTYIQAKSPAGVPQIATSGTATARFQSQQLTELNLLNSTTTEVADLADYLLGRYKDPIIRFTGVLTQLAALSSSDQNDLLSVDLTDIASVTKTFDVGQPSSVTQTLITSGIAHEIRPGSHVVRFTYESTDANSYLTLDNAIFGTLDNNLLAF
jgi:hypothetical protein